MYVILIILKAKSYFCNMKILSSFLLLLFIIFNSTPTLVMLIEKKIDISIVNDLSEEENQKESKEIKDIIADFIIKNSFEFIVFKFKYSKEIISENVLKHNLIFEEIFIPPPELI